MKQEKLFEDHVLVSVQDFVRERLSGFEFRQRAREEDRLKKKQGKPRKAGGASVLPAAVYLPMMLEDYSE